MFYGEEIGPSISAMRRNAASQHAERVPTEPSQSHGSRITKSNDFSQNSQRQGPPPQTWHWANDNAARADFSQRVKQQQLDEG